MGRGEGREKFANKRSCIAKGREVNTKKSLGLRNKMGRGGGGSRLPFKANVTPLLMCQLGD